MAQAQSTDCWLRIQNKQTFVHFHGWFLSKDYLYLAMEYCSFGDVSKCFPDPLCEVETRRICEQLLEGLVVLHEMGIAHRDIKPQVSQLIYDSY